ncbi:hypothetical protein T484DRAFT_2707946, partial [Baffinella frigidus]
GWPPLCNNPLAHTNQKQDSPSPHTRHEAQQHGASDKMGLDDTVHTSHTANTQYTRVLDVGLSADGMFRQLNQCEGLNHCPSCNVRPQPRAPFEGLAWFAHGRARVARRHRKGRVRVARSHASPLGSHCFCPQVRVVLGSRPDCTVISQGERVARTCDNSRWNNPPPEFTSICASPAANCQCHSRHSSWVAAPEDGVDDRWRWSGEPPFCCVCAKNRGLGSFHALACSACSAFRAGV